MRKVLTFTVMLLFAILMFSVSYGFAEIYDLFCRVTGFGGTTQQAVTLPDEVHDREFTVQFNSDIDPALPWKFKPMQRKQRIKVGENKLAFFEVENTTDKPITGTATYNVTPTKMGPFFTKVYCFCFEEQTLQPGERIEYPVSYFIDPDIIDDKNTQDVHTITLSYTFFPVKTSD